MLTAYLQAAMRRAQYKQLESGIYYGEIPELEGLYAIDDTLEQCREELQSALEDWLLFGLSNGFPIPPLDGIDLTTARVA